MEQQTAVAELQSRLTRRERELEAARRVSEAVKQQASVDEIVTAAISVAVEVIGARAGSVMLADPEKKELIFRVSVGDNPVAPGTAIPWEQGIAGRTFHSGLPQIVRDLPTQAGYFAGIDELTGFKTLNMFALPLKPASGQTIGVMEVLNKSDGGPEEEDLAVLSIIATLTAMTIEQARLFEAAKLAEVVHRLSDVGHDIKNMLMPVTVGMEILQKDLRSWLDAPPLPGTPKAHAIREQMQEALAITRRAVRRVQDRVRQITNYVKGREAPPVFERCAVSEIVNEVVSTLRLVAAEHHITINVEGMAQLPVIVADKNRLYTALYNLVDNAIPETPAGGQITLRGELDPAQGMLVLRVTDTGRGMPPHVRASLFKNHTRTSKPGGTGLGTKIVHDVAVTHQGRIEVQSELGKGTTFSLWLPITRQ